MKIPLYHSIMLLASIVIISVIAYYLSMPIDFKAIVSYIRSKA